MKNKLIIIGILFGLIITSATNCFASSENTVVAKVLEDKTEVKIGESFTVTLNASCANGISGLVGISYDYDTEKLEVTQETIGQGFMSFESDGMNLMYSGDTIVTEAEVFTITFTVKDGVELGDTTVNFAEAILVASDSNEHTVPEQNITVNIIEDSTGDEGAGDEGTGDEGTGDEGTGDEGTGNEGTGNEGTGDEGTGDEGTGDEGTGDEGTGNEGTGDEGTGDEGAGNEECSHTYEIKNDGTYHWEECTKCQEQKTGIKESHTYGEYKDNGNGTHSATCTECGYKLTENHNNNGGTCKYCNAVISSSSNNNNNNNNDQTTVDKEIPKAGLSVMLLVGMAAVVIVAVVMYRKNQKYQDIK